MASRMGVARPKYFAGPHGVSDARRLIPSLEVLLESEALLGLMETNPIQFYKCFISYSTQDAAFADALNLDLNETGISTWKWDRDAVRGRDLWQNIDRAIRSHDKTILICSANSLDSAQV